MNTRSWQIIGAPVDFGSQHQGTSLGPAAIRRAGLARRMEHLGTLGFQVRDAGDVDFEGSVAAEATCRGLGQMLRYAPSLMERLRRAYEADRVPLVLGGDHSIPIATVSAAAGCLRKRLGPHAALGLIWVDAHPDLETPTPDVPQDLHAMSAAHLLGVGDPRLCSLGEFAPKVEPPNIVYIGVRTAETTELQFLRDHELTVYTASDVERQGFVSICQEVFERLNGSTDGLAVSFDMDVIDPAAAPGVDYPHPGGLTVREALVFMEFVSRVANLLLLEVVELNPRKDCGDQTAQLAARLVQRAITGPILPMSYESSWWPLK